ncbi:MAG: general secretion pathway protein GspD, partial [Burkholderiales bacterium]|nr:general secretion pathway protein GspD [Burkholderiales bacterium]
MNRSAFSISTVLVFALIAGPLAGCATPPAWERANQLLADGRPEEALPQLEEAVKSQPRNATYRAALLRERARVAGEQLARGDQWLRAGALDEAQAAFEAAQRTDPDNGRAGFRLKELAQARQHQQQVRGAQAMFERGDAPAAEAVLRSVLAENPYQRDARALLRRVVEQGVAAAPEPKLVAPFRKPITLEFRDAPIRTVFDLLSRTSGINFVFDRDVKPDARITVFLRNTSLEDALKLILTTNTLDRKLLNENSVLIYPNTPAKQKDYKDLLVRSWYLANADVKQASAMVKALMKSQDVFIDEKLNLMVIKDTPEVVRLADQLVRTLDVAEPEVMLEVEVLEVARSRLDEIGVRWPTSVNLTAAGPGNAIGTGTATLVDAPQVFTTSNPLLVFNLRATVGQTNLLANPRIRVRNKEKARVHIGDKVPVFTTTATANVGVATSVSYLDVGLKLDVEPQIYLQDEVGIKVGLEVSNIIETITTNNSVAYRLGTR